MYIFLQILIILTTTMDIYMGLTTKMGGTNMVNFILNNRICCGDQNLKLLPEA